MEPINEGEAMARKRKQLEPGDPRKAIAYLRVSTDDQNLGPESQSEQIASYCEREGIELLATFADHGISGAAPIDKRPALLEAVGTTKELGAGLLLVAKRDRLARDVECAAIVTRLVECNGAQIRSADGVGNEDTPEGGLLRGIVDLFAQYERAMIASRTRSALAVKRSKGERLGSIPYGRRVASDGVHLEDNPAELRAIAVAVELREAGQSFNKIARALDAAGHAPRGGGSWHHQTVVNIIRAESARQKIKRAA
jgi:DNA invertase Pin-like site-specific DNA recombinase